MLLTEDNLARATFSGRATQAPPLWKRSCKKDKSSGFPLLMEFRDFWAYFEPIRENMPKNCSADVQAVISYVDEVFTGTNETAIEGVKDAFGLGAITYLDDAAGARKPQILPSRTRCSYGSLVRNNLWDWQSLQITSGPNGSFRASCTALVLIPPCSTILPILRCPRGRR